MQNSVEVVPDEKQTDDVIPPLDHVVMIVDGQQIAAAEREDGFQHVAIPGAEPQARAIGQLAPFAEMELADLIGREPLAAVEHHVEHRTYPRQQQQPAHHGGHARIELRLQRVQVPEQVAQHGDVLQVFEVFRCQPDEHENADPQQQRPGAEVVQQRHQKIQRARR